MPRAVLALQGNDAQKRRAAKRGLIIMAADHSSQQPSPYPAEKARGGEIILKTRARRMIFVGGLVAIVLLLLSLAFLG